MLQSNYNLKLDTVNSNSFDLKLYSEADLDFDKYGSLSSDGVITDNLAFYYDFAVYTDINNIYSLSPTNNSFTGCTGFTLYDIGLTEVDTGYINTITGQTLFFDSGSTLILKPVTGNLRNYNISLINDRILNLNVLNLKGGFYQGFYKLFKYPLETVPNRTQYGFSFNFWLNKDNTPLTGNVLTGDSIFFFMGTRAENKFYNIFSGETGITTSSNILLSSQATGGTGDTNGIAFYYNNNYLGFKNIINRQDESGNTFNYIQSSGQTFTQDLVNGWTNICITWTRNSPLTLCEDGRTWLPHPTLITRYSGCSGITCDGKIPDTQLGILKFFINARPIFEMEIEEPIFRKLADVDKDCQQGVPYNISIGGGTQGLLESQTFNGPDLADQNLFMYNNFGGVFNGTISIASMYTYPLSVPEIIRNFIAKQTIYDRDETFGGPEIITSIDLTNI